MFTMSVLKHSAPSRSYFTGRIHTHAHTENWRKIKSVTQRQVQGKQFSHWNTKTSLSTTKVQNKVNRSTAI